MNGWSMNTDTMGVYGNYYLKRALVAQVGLGANLPEDAIYPVNLADDTGKPLDGSNNYILHFEKGTTPPANAFWSVTLYDNDGFQVGNPINRSAVSSWMPFKYNADGSLDLYFQNENPGNDKDAQLASGSEGPLQPDHAPLRAKIGGAHWQVEPAARHALTIDDGCGQVDRQIRKGTAAGRVAAMGTGNVWSWPEADVCGLACGCPLFDPQADLHIPVIGSFHARHPRAWDVLRTNRQRVWRSAASDVPRR